MAIDELLERVNAQSSTTVQKPTLVSNLSRYVQHGDTFARPAPSTYGLIAWNSEQVPAGVEPEPARNDSEPSDEPEPPEYF